MHNSAYLTCLFWLCPSASRNAAEPSWENQGSSLIQSTWNVGKMTLHDSMEAAGGGNHFENRKQEKHARKGAEGLREGKQVRTVTEKVQPMSADGRPCQNDTRSLQEGHIPNPPPLTLAPALNQRPQRQGLHVAHIFYINEDRSADRREAIESRLPHEKFPYSRFAAVNRSSISAYDLLTKPLCNMKAEDKHTTDSTYACAQSHLEVYRKIVREDPHGKDAYLILEDDANLTEGWYEKLNSTLPLVPADAVALILGAEGLAHCKDEVAPGLFLATHPSYTLDASGKGRNWYLGSLGTLVWPRTLPMLIKKIENQDFACHSDVNLLSAGAARSYALFPPVVKNAGFKSTMND